MKIVFAGSPSIAVPCIKAVADGERRGEPWTLTAALTNPDSPKGRHGAATETELAAAVRELRKNDGSPTAVPLLKPEKPDSAIEEVRALAPDLLVSFAYGRIFSAAFLSCFKLGGINVHPSLLPAYRGASPIQQAILDRVSVTGISIQRLALKTDSGAVLEQIEMPLSGRETALSLSDRVAAEAPAPLLTVLRRFAGAETDADVKGREQDEAAATYCREFGLKDAFVDWKKSASVIDAQIRAFNPKPLAWTLHDGKELALLAGNVYNESTGGAVPGRVAGTDKKAGILIETGRGVLAVTRLQYKTRKALEWKDFLNGVKDFKELG